MSEPETRDTGYAPDRWAFDEEVTRVFDDMLRRSIPDYDTMRAAVHAVGARFVKAGTVVADLGCSRGEAVAPFVDHFGGAVRFVLVETAPAMLAAARARFRDRVEEGVVAVHDLDLRRAYPASAYGSSLALAVLTLQFTPIEHRQRIVSDVYDSLIEGGAFIVVEKVLGSTAKAEELLTGVYLDSKRANGYSEEEIQRKRLALEGVLVPVAASWNEQLLRSARFREVECFWRWMNFAAWVAVK